MPAANSATRCQVSCSMVSSPASGRNCLGKASRDSGHRRVPEPPDSRTGRSHGSCSDIVDSIENGGGQFTLCPECFVPSETGCPPQPLPHRSEEHTSELQSLMRISYAVLCLKKKKKDITAHDHMCIKYKCVKTTTLN